MLYDLYKKNWINKDKQNILFKLPTSDYPFFVNKKSKFEISKLKKIYKTKSIKNIVIRIFV